MVCDSIKRVVGSSLRNKVAKVREREAGRLYLYARNERRFWRRGLRFVAANGTNPNPIPEPYNPNPNPNPNPGPNPITLTLEPVWLGSG